MDYWTPLWSSIVDSSVWTEPYFVRVLWLTMLAVKDRDHVVRRNAFGLAQLAKMTEREVLDGLQILKSPDTRRLEKQEFDGRRIEKMEDGWLILNGAKYQRKVSDLTRKARQAEWAREDRAKKKARKGKPLPGEAAFEKAVERGAGEAELSRLSDNSFMEIPPEYRTETQTLGPVFDAQNTGV